MDRQSDRATDTLRGLIVTLAIDPGSVIDEASLSARLDCGRTPLREALHRLSEERLVVILPRRAVAVANIALTDLQHIYEARLVLEGEAARLAALRATPQILDKLEGSTNAVSSPVGLDAFGLVTNDFAFHHVLGKSAGNPYLYDNIRRILGPAMRLTYLAYKHGQPSQQTFEEHSAILAALRAGDSETAERAARDHVQMAKERTLRRL